ncbi:MAG: LysR family transcriptional regulator [Halioglobus sp.]
MDTRELHKVDLNLLISLQVLLDERSVSRAAERLFITQPAMSKTLTRLRALFDDPLFTRSSHGMQPTPRAAELAAGLHDILGNITHLLAGPRVEPESFRGEVVLALSEYIGVALLPRLIAQLSTQAPRLCVRVITRIENQLDELAQGNLDFIIHVRQAQYPEDYRVEHLGGSPLAVLVRNEHALTREEITWEHLSRYPLLKLYASSQEQQEVQRNASATVPITDHPLGTLEISHLLTAMEVLRQTDYFMPTPAFLLQQENATTGITGLPLPGPDGFSINYALVAHRRTANSPMHSWLWDQITYNIRELRTPVQRKLRQRMTAGSVATR